MQEKRANTSQNIRTVFVGTFNLSIPNVVCVHKVFLRVQVKHWEIWLTVIRSLWTLSVVPQMRDMTLL